MEKLATDGYDLACDGIMRAAVDRRFAAYGYYAKTGGNPAMLKKVFFGALWVFVLYVIASFALGFVAGFVVGVTHPGSSEEVRDMAANELMERYIRVVEFGAIGLALLGTAMGWLPGTKRQDRRHSFCEIGTQHDGRIDVNYMCHFDCECGNLLTVELVHAGITIQCPSCHRDVCVPNLMKLKRLAAERYSHLKPIPLAPPITRDPPPAVIRNSGVLHGLLDLFGMAMKAQAEIFQHFSGIGTPYLPTTPESDTCGESQEPSLTVANEPSSAGTPTTPSLEDAKPLGTVTCPHCGVQVCITATGHCPSCGNAICSI